MSEFDPSLLEGKDRNELVAIATSLGRKPPSRAKKADIVALIMELVGAEPAGDATADGADAKKTDSGARGADTTGGDGGSDDPDRRRSRGGADGSGEKTADRSGGRAADQSSGRSADQPSGRSGGRGGGRGGGKDGGKDGADDGDDKGRGRGSGGDRPSGTKDGDKSSDRPSDKLSDKPSDRSGDKASDRGGNGSASRPDGGDARGGDQPDTHNRADQQQQTDDADGNRRRRRRGRDRGRGQDAEAVAAEPVDVEGIVDLRSEGFGFLRVRGYLPHPDDAYISVKQVRQFGLRAGDLLTGKSRVANRNEKNPALVQIETLNGSGAGDPNALPERVEFDDLTPIFPDQHLRLEQEEFPENLTARLIDLLAPIGKGQRGLIVSPPKAGKTTVVKDIVRAIERNHPEVHVIVLLIDERPEEVTGLRRWMMNGEVAASTFDRPVEEHIAVADLVIERAKRMVEGGRDVAVVLDGITRLTRAHNLAASGNGRTMAGGMDAAALYPPKKLFGAARNLEEGGSLTILATALVETNTRLDEVIFEEFKGTGNMELRLDRQLAQRRIFPAIDVDGSSTRHEELLYDRKRLAQIHRLRRMLSELVAQSGSGAAGLEMVIERLKELRTNAEFLDDLAKNTP